MAMQGICLIKPSTITFPKFSNSLGIASTEREAIALSFSSPDKILAYSGMSPSTYQSGQLTNCYSHMEKRGSRYLRFALYNAAKYVCYWEPTFAAYLSKKRSEGKHYNVALSHAVKKLVRVIYHLEKTGQSFKAA